jgi:hypothetical protein
MLVNAKASPNFRTVRRNASWPGKNTGYPYETKQTCYRSCLEISSVCLIFGQLGLHVSVRTHAVREAIFEPTSDGQNRVKLDEFACFRVDAWKSEAAPRAASFADHAAANGPTRRGGEARP